MGSGGFRKACKAKNTATGSNPTTWVVKRCLDNVKREIEDLGLSVEEHTKNIVQMHTLAKNIASQLTKKVNKKEITVDFGDRLQFKDVFFPSLVVRLLPWKNSFKVTSLSMPITLERFMHQRRI